MPNFQLGTTQTAQVERKIDTGYVLIIFDEEVLLHHNETEDPLEIGDELDVFVYHDKHKQVIATTTIPTVQYDTYDWAEVVEVIPNLGAFVSIGIQKDMLVSIDDLPLYTEVWPRPGDKLYVTLDFDQEGRLLAIPATESIFMYEREIASEELFNKNVTAYVYHTSREGAAVFTDENFRGFIHHTERNEEPRLGQAITGRVIDIKEDGTINISLKPRKGERIDDDAQVILTFLNENDGVIAFGDKSDAEAIRETFHMSKAAFKRALGRLMKDRKVKQQDDKTYLLK